MNVRELNFPMQQPFPSLSPGVCVCDNDSSFRDMTHGCVWHDSFICMTCLIHTCDMTHLLGTWLTHVWYCYYIFDMTFIYLKVPEIQFHIRHDVHFRLHFHIELPAQKGRNTQDLTCTYSTRLSYIWKCHVFNFKFDMIFIFDTTFIVTYNTKVMARTYERCYVWKCHVFNFIFDMTLICDTTFTFDATFVCMSYDQWSACFLLLCVCVCVCMCVDTHDMAKANW